MFGWFRRQPWGSIVAKPNPVRVDADTSLWVTTLKWKAHRTLVVEVRLNAPDGTLIARGGPYGECVVRSAVSKGARYFLQDASARDSHSLLGTLDSVRVEVKEPGKARTKAARAG